MDSRARLKTLREVRQLRREQWRLVSGRESRRLAARRSSPCSPGLTEARRAQIGTIWSFYDRGRLKWQGSPALQIYESLQMIQTFCPPSAHRSPLFPADNSH